MMHIIKNYIQTETNLIDQIRGKFKEQIVLSIALDDVQYEDEYINQLEQIKPFLSEIPFLELLIQKNLFIKFNTSNKIAKYFTHSFFSEIPNPSIKRIVFKDVLHSAHNNSNKGVNLSEKQDEFNYQGYINWVLTLVGSIRSIGELDLNVNQRFLNKTNTAALKESRISKLQIYIDYHDTATNLKDVLENIQSNSLRYLKINIKENTVQIKEIFHLLHQLFTYIGTEQVESIQEIILYNVFDDMLSKPNINNSYLSNNSTKILSLLGAKKEKELGQDERDKQKNGKECNRLKNEIENNDELDIDQMKQQMTTRFIETITSLQNLSKLVVNAYLLDILCLDTLNTLILKANTSSHSPNISQQQSFQDIPLCNSHQSSQILDWNKQVSQDGSSNFIKLPLQFDDTKSIHNTPQSIKITNEQYSIDIPKTQSNQTINLNKQKSIFKSHAIEGMIFKYSSKIEPSRKIESLIRNSNQTSQEIVKDDSNLELADTQPSSNDSAKNINGKNSDINSKNSDINGKHSDLNGKHSNINSKYSDMNGNGYSTPTKKSGEQKLPPFVLFPQQEKQDSVKKYDLDDIPFFSIDSVQTEEINQNQLSPQQVENQQQPTPVFGDIDPQEVIQQESGKRGEKQRKMSFNQQTDKESIFSIASSVTHREKQTDNNDVECTNITSLTEEMRMNNSLSSNQMVEYKLKQPTCDAVLTKSCLKQLSLSLKINQSNRIIAKHLIQYLSPRLKEISMQLNDYDDSQWTDYISQESFTQKRLVIQWSYKLMRTPPLKSVEAINIFHFLREKQTCLQNLTLQLVNKKHFCPKTCQSLQDFITNHSTLKTFNFETCMFPSQMEFYKFLVCIAKSSIRHIEICGPKFEVLSDEANLISPWKSYLSNRLRSLSIIGQNYSLKVMSTISKWKMLRLAIIHLSPMPTLPYSVQQDIIQNSYLFSFQHKNLLPNNIAHLCYDQIHTIIIQYTLFSQSFYPILTYSPEITFWDLFFD